MNWSEAPSGAIFGASQRLWVAMGDEANVVAGRINSDPDFVKRLAAFAMSGGHQPSTSQKHAREIMGTNFFGVEEAMKHFGVNPTKQQLAALGEIPFAEEVLTSCKNSHVLVAIFPLSVLDVRTKVAPSNLFYKQDWFNRERFAKDKGEIGWQLVCKMPVENSTNKSWDEQQVLIGKTEETPTAQVMVYTIIGHFLATGEQLFEKLYVRTSSLDSDGPRVGVGDFDAEGLHVGNVWDDVRFDRLGVSSARKT